MITGPVAAIIAAVGPLRLRVRISLAFLERHEADRPSRLGRRPHQGVYGTEDFFKPGVGLEIEGKQSGARDRAIVCRTARA
jgi:hypothetical protein